MPSHLDIYSADVTVYRKDGSVLKVIENVPVIKDINREHDPHFLSRIFRYWDGQKTVMATIDNTRVGIFYKKIIGHTSYTK